MLAPFPMGLRATNPRPKPKDTAAPAPAPGSPMHHPRIPSPALSSSSTDSDDSLSLLSICDLPPFSDQPTYYEQPAPPRPPRNPERLKEVPFVHRRPEPAPSPYPPPSAPLPPLPFSTETLPQPDHSLDRYPSLPAEQEYPSPLHILTHPYSSRRTQFLADPDSPALNQLTLRKELTPSPLSISPRLSPRPRSPPPLASLPSPPTTPVTSSPPAPPRLRSTTHPEPNPRPKVHFNHSLPGPHPNHPHPNKAYTMYPIPGGLSPWSRPHPAHSSTHPVLIESNGTMSERDSTRGGDTIQSRHRPSRLTFSSVSSGSTGPAGRLSQSSDETANSYLASRGPVGVPLLGAGPGALVPRSGSLPYTNGRTRVLALPISTSPRSVLTLISDSDSDDTQPMPDNHTAPPSEAALVLNVHGGLDTSSRLHHRFVRKEVPYPRSYERGILDLDILDMLLTRQMSGGSLTWHVFPPSWNVPVQGARKKVLDIGCGNGAWVIEAAKCWRGCEVVGLDVVSLHPNLVHTLKDKDLARRVSWIQANFLEGLPFDSDYFDFVHVKRIARGVPENRWPPLLEEIIRVMKPGAALEVVEEDLSFPGYSEHDGSEVGTLRSRRSNISVNHRDSYLSALQITGVEPERSCAVESTSSTSDSGNSNPAIVVGAKPDSRPTPSATSSSSSRPSVIIDIQPSSSKSSIAPKHPSISISLPGDAPWTTSPTDMHRTASLRQSSPTPKAPKSQKRPSTATSYAPSTHTHMSVPSPSSTPAPARTSTASSSSSGAGSSIIRPPPTTKSNQAALDTLRQPNGPFFGPSTSPASKNMTINPPPKKKLSNKANADVLSEPAPPSFFTLQGKTSLGGEGKDKGKDKEGGQKAKGRGSIAMNLFGRNTRAPEVPVSLPVDVAQVNQTEAAMVSGIEGGSSLGSTLFPGNGSGPCQTNGGPPQVIGNVPPANGILLAPVNGNLPPQVDAPEDPRDHTILQTIYRQMHDDRFINLSPLSLLADMVGHLFENVRTHPPIVFRFPPSRETTPYDTRSPDPNTHGSSTGTNDRKTGNGNANAIISLDGLSNGASPYASLDASTSTSTQARMRLPNPALDVDLRSLNLHLALRVKEIVACAEAMWEWVSEFQMREPRKGKGKEDGVYAVILELTRARFDELVLRFELDMREHMGLGSVLEDRFNWTVIPGPTPQEKRLFDTACEKWDAYQRLVNSSTGAVPHPATRLSRSLGVFVAWKRAAPHAQL